MGNICKANNQKDVERMGTKKPFWAGGVGSFLVALFGVLAASCVSLYSGDIVEQGKQLMQSNFDTLEMRSYWELYLTVALIAISLSTVYLRERGQSKIVDQRAAELDARISTMPPQSFLDEYSKALRSIGEVRRETKIDFNNNDLTSECLEQSIRKVLKVVLSLARLWDGVSNRDDQLVYRCNIMTVIDESSVEELKNPGNPLEGLINDSPFFLFKGNLLARIEHSSGLLLLETNSLTSNSDVVGSDPDDKVKPICFPFSLKNGGQPNLPGAPEAVVNKSAAYIGNTTLEINQWLDNLSEAEPYFYNQYERDIRAYYENIKEAQSILSIPIEIENEVIAMLNIYRNKDEIFKGEDRARQFVSLMNPICYHLSKMLKLGSEIE